MNRRLALSGQPNRDGNPQTLHVIDAINESGRLENPGFLKSVQWFLSSSVCTAIAARSKLTKLWDERSNRLFPRNLYGPTSVHCQQQSVRSRVEQKVSIQGESRDRDTQHSGKSGLFHGCQRLGADGGRAGGQKPASEGRD